MILLVSGVISASQETEDNEPSITDPGLQPDPFQPDSGLVVASIPPPHLSSETASPAPRQGEQTDL